MIRVGLLAGLVVTVLTLTVSAWAARPLHDQSTFSDSFTFNAGELCDFNYVQEFTVVDNTLVYGDPENPDKVLTQEKQYVTHTNVDTGYTLSEVDHLALTFTLADAHNGGTRLLLRVRGRTRPWWLTATYVAALVPADYIMARSMLAGIARRVRRQRAAAA